jgi:protein-disulfide isomerase
MRRLLPLSALLCLLPLSACAPQTQGQSLAMSSSSAASVEPVLPDGAAASSADAGVPLATIPETLNTQNGTLTLGDPAAPELLVYDNQAGRYALELSQTVLPRLLADFVRTRKLRVTFITVPFRKFPDTAAEAAAVLCAAREQKGLAMRGQLVVLPTHTPAAVLKAAGILKLNAKAFSACLNAPETKAAIAAQLALPESDGVSLVPTFRLNAARQTGLPSYPDLRGWLTESLSAQSR